MGGILKSCSFFEMKHLQSVDSHAGPLLNLDSTIGGSRGAYLVARGDADGDHQTARQNAVVPRVHRDDEGRCCAHGLILEEEV